MNDSDHDLDTTLAILEQNLQEVESADSPGEKQTALANYLSAVNTLVAHSHRFAEEELGEGMESIVQQKRNELGELLEEID